MSRWCHVASGWHHNNTADAIGIAIVAGAYIFCHSSKLFQTVHFIQTGKIWKACDIQLEIRYLDYFYFKIMRLIWNLAFHLYYNLTSNIDFILTWVFFYIFLSLNSSETLKMKETFCMEFHYFWKNICHCIVVIGTLSRISIDGSIWWGGDGPLAPKRMQTSYLITHGHSFPPSIHASVYLSVCP
jgi:hypothetical protein